VQADAADYLVSMTDKVDVILHDAYDASGLALGTGNTHFFRQCINVLAGDGLFVSNLLGETPDLLPAMLATHGRPRRIGSRRP
jgi:spermidine synthase